MTRPLIEIFEYELPFRQTLQLHSRTFTKRKGLIIKLGRSEKHAGYGEIAPLPGFSPESLDQARAAAIKWSEYAIKYDPGVTPDSEELLDSLTPSVLFGVESATLGMAHAGGTRLANGLYDHYRRTVLVNGLVSGPPDQAAAKAHDLRARGYMAVKVKLGGPNVAQDIETVREVAKVLGEGVALRLDANRTWDFDTALTFARGIDGCPIEYIEEPLAAPGRLAEFVGRSGLPVALDETIAENLFEPQFLDGKEWVTAVILKPTVLGGASTTEAWAAEATEHGMKPVITSCFESGVGLAALAHLTAAIVPENVPAGLDTYDWLAEDVLSRRFEVRNGMLDLDEMDACVATVDTSALAKVYSA